MTAVFRIRIVMVDNALPEGRGEQKCRGTVCGDTYDKFGKACKICIANFTRFTNLAGLEENGDTTVPYFKNKKNSKKVLTKY